MARLEVEIDPSGARSGARRIKRDLRDITKEADRASASTERFGTKTASSMNKAGSATSKFINKANLARAAVVALTAAAAKGFGSALGMDRALAEASTLLEGTTEEMALMRKEARAMAAEFGGGATQQVEAFYQAISAGSETVAEAADLLQVSNVLAKGGVTGITTAVDILTTATNSYASTNLTATDAADILFAGVTFGKTTINELASALGRATPLAAKLGISFDELVGATAALTKGGVSTAEAITGIRGIMAAVLKPTQEAKDAAKDLSLEFNAAAVDEKGFVGFLQDVIDKTGGSSTVMAQLFGGMEGLSGVLGLATNNGAMFNAAMEVQADRLGSAQAAADKMSEALSGRLDVAASKAGLVFQTLGNVLLNVIVPAFEAVVWAGEQVIMAGNQLVVWFKAAWETSTTFKAAVISLAGAITASLIPTILSLGVALVGLALSNPFTALALGATVAAVAIINNWDTVLAWFEFKLPAMLSKGKAEWGYFVSDVLVIINNLAKGMVTVMTSAFNAAFIEPLNKIIRFAHNHPAIATVIFGPAGFAASKVSEFDKITSSFEGFTAVQGAAEKALAEANDEFDRGLGLAADYATAVDAIGTRTIEDPLDAFGGAGVPVLPTTPANVSTAPSGGGASEVDKTRAAFDALRASLDEVFAAEMALADGQRIVNEAMNAGTISTEQAGNALGLVKNQFELATDAGRQMQESLADSISQSMGDALMSVVDGTKSVGEAFRTMALAIAKELFQVIVIEQMVLALKTAIGGFGDGGLFSGGSVVPSADGNLFSGGNVVPFANGGVVNSPTLFPMSSGIGLMGEAGPEAIMPLSRGSDGKLGVKNNGGGSNETSSGGDTTVINVLDPSIVGQFLDTADGRRVIMNIVGEEQVA